MSKESRKTPREESSNTEEESVESKAKKAKVASLKDDYLERLGETIERCSAVGCVMIAGANEDEEFDSDSDVDDYTGEEIDRLRHVVVTKNREKEIDKCEKKYGHTMWNTHTGNVVIMSLKKSINAYERKYKKSLLDKFDAFFALTYVLNQFDPWIYDNELYGEGEECEDAIASLAKAWKKMLSHSDDELGIDSDFTRPGVECLLDRFKDKVKDIGCDISYPFDWKPKDYMKKKNEKKSEREGFSKLFKNSDAAYKNITVNIEDSDDGE